MSVIGIALAGVLLVAHAPLGEEKSVTPSVVSFFRSEVVPVDGARGMFVVPSMTKRHGDIAAGGIAIPHLGAVVLTTFDCVKHTFAISGVGEVHDDGGDKLTVGDIEAPKSAHVTDMTPIADADEHWLSVEKAVCGNPT